MEVFPEYFYRYRSADTWHFWEEVEQAISSSKIWLSQLTAQNDPFEARPCHERSSIADIRLFLRDFSRITGGKFATSGRPLSDFMVGSGASKAKVRKQLGPTMEGAVFHRETAFAAFEAVRGATLIASFSEVCDSLLMWSHYTSSHKGICLEYQMDDFGMYVGGVGFARLDYADVRPVVTTVDALNYIGHQNFDGLPCFDSARARKTFDDSLLTKSSDWSYEKEWRLCSSGDELPGYRIIPGLKVSAIYIGANSSRDVEEKITAAFGSNLPIYKMMIDKREYKLVPRSL